MGGKGGVTKSYSGLDWFASSLKTRLTTEVYSNELKEQIYDRDVCRFQRDLSIYIIVSLNLD